MANLLNIRSSVTSMSLEQALEIHRNIRQNRRISKRAIKAEKKESKKRVDKVDTLFGKMSKEDIQALLMLLDGKE